MANEIDVRLRDKIDGLNRRIRDAQNRYGSNGGRDDATIRVTVNMLRAERANLQSYLDARRDARHG